MRFLASCPASSAAHLKTGRYRGAIVDKRTKQRIEFGGDDPFVVYTLDDDSVEWEGKRPDGVVIADIDGATYVCFIEIKGSNDVARAFSQLEGGARHFAPARRVGGAASHGDEHHDAWSMGEDAIDVMPSREHHVLGVFLTFRSMPQPAPAPPLRFGGKPFPRKAVQVAKRKPNWAEITPRELLSRAGVLP